MKFIVAIITRNRAEQLKRCLDSLTHQTVNAFSVLIVDNGSTDNTKRVIDSFKKRLEIKYHFESRPGAPYARNKALSVITGDVMATIDDDCEAFPNWIENIQKAHKEFTEAIAIQGWAISRPLGGLISIIAQFIQESGFKENTLCKKNFLYHFNNEFLRKPAPILLLDAKNASFKLKKLKTLGRTFNTSWKHGDDLEFSKQLLSEGEKIIFYPQSKAYHWERPAIRQFLRQRYGAGGEVMNAQLHFSKKLFPKRKPLWWVGRSLNFILYLFRRRYFAKSLILVPMFILERSVCMAGRYMEYWRYKLSVGISQNIKK